MATRQRRETSPTPDPAGEASIDAYHRGFPPAIRARLEEIRVAIREAAPQATETISYGMPAFRQRRILVYYAAHDRHLGFYPTPSAIQAFGARLKGYVFSKGAVQFPWKEPLPVTLIQEMVKHRVAEEDRQTRSPKRVSARPGQGNPPKPPHALQPPSGNRLLHHPAGRRRGGASRGAAPGGRAGGA